MGIYDLPILLASDHGGFDLKRHLAASLRARGIHVLDLGPDTADSVDYPDFAQKAARAILEGRAERGILICGTGIGISIAANRFRGIRCALCHSVEMARLARAHNDANLLALAGRFTAPEEAERIVQVFLATPFEGGRHAGRVGKIENC